MVASWLVAAVVACACWSCMRVHGGDKQRHARAPPAQLSWVGAAAAGCGAFTARLEACGDLAHPAAVRKVCSPPRPCLSISHKSSTWFCATCTAAAHTPCHCLGPCVPAPSLCLWQPPMPLTHSVPTKGRSFTCHPMQTRLAHCKHQHASHCRPAHNGLSPKVLPSWDTSSGPVYRSGRTVSFGCSAPLGPCSSMSSTPCRGSSSSCVAGAEGNKGREGGGHGQSADLPLPQACNSFADGCCADLQTQDCQGRNLGTWGAQQCKQAKAKAGSIAARRLHGCTWLVCAPISWDIIPSP